MSKVVVVSSTVPPSGRVARVAGWRAGLVGLLASVFVASLAPRAAAADGANDLAAAYAKAIDTLNEEHARKPGTETEAALAKKLPREALAALDALLKREGADVPPALIAAGEAALGLDRVEDFEKIRARLAKLAPDEAKKLGIVLSRPRAILMGRDGVEKSGLTAVADVLDEVLAAYDAVYGFAEYSKVPGKKLRVRVRLVTKIEAPPHFAPEFPYHSEIDFPVIDASSFASPTKDGQFLLYGLAHELGHVVAMWGDASNEEDHHAWAHYTGLVVVTWLATNRADAPALKNCKDVRWRSVDVERQKLVAGNVRPGRDTKEAVLELLFETHDMIGPKAIGEAINALDKKDERLRVNRVRYYTFDAFGAALRAAPSAKKKVRDVDALFPR